MISVWPSPSPERRRQYSPGQRPGKSIALSGEALKGRHSGGFKLRARPHAYVPVDAALTGLGDLALYPQGVALGYITGAFQAAFAVKEGHHA